jgi:Taurine catabolism dioxygenase TauD, TfdA family
MALRPRWLKRAMRNTLASMIPQAKLQPSAPRSMVRTGIVSAVTTPRVKVKVSAIIKPNRTSEILSIGSRIRSADLAEDRSFSVFVRRRCGSPLLPSPPSRLSSVAALSRSATLWSTPSVTSENLIDFGRRFGELTVHPFAPHDDKAAVLIKFRNDETNPPFATDVWHSDETFRAEPPMATMLCAKVVPTIGGDTMFASMSAAFDGLSDRMQQFISGLEAIHDWKPFKFSPKFVLALEKKSSTEARAPRSGICGERPALCCELCLARYRHPITQHPSRDFGCASQGCPPFRSSARQCHARRNRSYALGIGGVALVLRRRG